MAKAKQAQIHCKDKRFPFALRVSQGANGKVYVDQVDTVTGKRQRFVQVKPKSLRNLAQWILDNVEE